MDWVATSGWQDDNFMKIISNPTGVYKLVMPRRFGKTHLLLRLQKYFIEQGKSVNVYAPSQRTLKAYEANGYIQHEKPDVILIDDFEHNNFLVPRPTSASLCILTTSDPDTVVNAEHTTLNMQLQ